MSRRGRSSGLMATNQYLPSCGTMRDVPVAVGSGARLRGRRRRQQADRFFAGDQVDSMRVEQKMRAAEDAVEGSQVIPQAVRPLAFVHAARTLQLQFVGALEGGIDGHGGCMRSEIWWKTRNERARMLTMAASSSDIERFQAHKLTSLR